MGHDGLKPVFSQFYMGQLKISARFWAENPHFSVSRHRGRLVLTGALVHGVWDTGQGLDFVHVQGLGTRNGRIESNGTVGRKVIAPIVSIVARTRWWALR